MRKHVLIDGTLLVVFALALLAKTPGRGRAWRATRSIAAVVIASTVPLTLISTAALLWPQVLSHDSLRSWGYAARGQALVESLPGKAVASVGLSLSAVLLFGAAVCFARANRFAVPTLLATMVINLVLLATCWRPATAQALSACGLVETALGSRWSRTPIHSVNRRLR